MINKKSWRTGDNGELTHDGDCFFWAKKICTCGLLHHLEAHLDDPLSEDEKKLIPKTIDVELAEHEEKIDKIS